MDIEGHVCMVTGAASGIGAAVVAELHSAGAALVVALDVAPRGRSAPETRRRRQLDVRADVSSPPEMRAAFDLVRREAGRLDVLFNNAGILGEPWPRQSPESLITLAAVNLGGVLMGTRLALDAMSGARGVVVNTASKTGLFGHAENAAYAATKAGVIHFTRCCAELAATHDVRVNAVLPGMTDTPLFGALAESAGPPSAARPLLRPEQVARVMLDVARDDDIKPGAFRMADYESIAGA